MYAVSSRSIVTSSGPVTSVYPSAPEIPSASVWTESRSTGVSSSRVPTNASPDSSSTSSRTRLPSASRAGAIKYDLLFSGGASELSWIPSIASSFTRM